MLLIEEGCWTQFIQKPEVQAKRLADEQSYVWDRLIERISRDVLNDNLEFTNDPDGTEVGLRVMARESRFGRRMLGQALGEFLHLAEIGEVRSRMTQSPSNVGYVFLAAQRDLPREDRNAELGCRCYVARSLLPDCPTIIGIGTERPGQNGVSWDVLYLSIPTLSNEQAVSIEHIKGELEFFSSPRQTHVHEDEYPGICPDEHQPNS